MPPLVTVYDSETLTDLPKADLMHLMQVIAYLFQHGCSHRNFVPLDHHTFYWGQLNDKDNVNDTLYIVHIIPGNKNDIFEMH